MQARFIAKFTGEMAEQHKMPAYDAVESLNGVARTMLITTNYIAENRVRYRDFHYGGYEVNLVAMRPGSFEALFEIVLAPEVIAGAGAIGLGVAGNLVTDLFKTVFRQSIGEPGERSIEQLEDSGQLHAGDLGALVDAVEPAIKRAHTVIGRGAQNIVVIKGDNNVVTFNERSKNYVNTSIRDTEIRIKIFSVGSYNVNSRYGRVFDFQEGKTIPFEVHADADRLTIETVMDSLSRYAMRRLGDDLASAAAMRYRVITAVDGRVKKIIVLQARREIAQLGGDRNF
ncbi:DUF7946 domain-containing protein [Brucella anthropi]|uniref:DUF7946 domain-containing protein n=1 Tax=Brucella anthropi TaxID=529 RepID=UPI002157EDBF|nr:hypothetical protein [Brucella anthropi]MCR8493161.1 hypothetical protein [Brucella anthropi]